MKRVLMIAFHFPPSHISSGIQRTLKFASYLPDHEWEPAVISAHPRAYPHTSADQLAEIPDGMQVIRAFALDTSRHLSIAGRFPLALALPDRWSSWALGGVAAGRRLIRRWRPDVIWSTYPIATAHRIGLRLHRETGIPWVADFRDSMTEAGYPTLAARRESFLKIERATIEHASRAVFTTPGAAKMYAERYPQILAEKWAVIPNGYDETNFREVEAGAAGPSSGGPLVLVHSGLLYPKERDPTAFFDALAQLVDAGRITRDTLRVRLRATGHDERYHAELRRRGLNDIVSLEPPVSYGEALREMLAADGLLLFQSASCNHQIPAKLYEYLRARRPVFALTDAAGDTAGALRAAGIDGIVPLDDPAEIQAGLERFLTSISESRAPLAPQDHIARLSRRARTAELAAVLDEVITGSGEEA